MANYLEMLRQKAFGTDPKQESVSAAAASKQDRLATNAAVMSQTGLGVATATPEELLLAGDNTLAARRQMGPGFENAQADMVRALEKQVDAGKAFRTGQDVAADTVTDLGMGVANAIGGGAAFVAGQFSPDTGLAISSQLDQMSKFAQSMQTRALQQRREASENRKALRKRDSDASATGKLARIGQGIIDGVQNITEDTALLGSGAAQAAGSVIAAAPMSLATGGSTAAAIGLMEGGGAFTATANEVMKMSEQELAQKSEAFRTLVSNGVPPTLAKRQIAFQAAQVSGYVQAPIAAATGRLVSKFESNPLSLVPSKEALANVGREVLEEGVQSLTGGVAGNVGKALADNTQNLYENVGEQAGEGAVLGGLSAGGMQTPSLAGGAVIKGGRTLMAGAKAAGASVGQRAEAVRTQNAKASPVADEKVQAAATQAVADAPAAVQTMSAAVDASDAAPEVKTAVHQYVQDIANTVAYDPSYASQEGMTPDVAAVLEGSTSRADAIQRLADGVEKAQDMSAALRMAFALYDTIQPINDLRENANESNIRAAMGSPEALASLAQFDRVLANMDNTPKVRKALDYVEKKLVPQMAAKLQAEPIVEATPEQAQQAALVAQVSPEKLPAATARAVLKQAEGGKLQLTDAQRQSLMVSAAIVEAAQAYDAQMTSMGHPRKQDIVSKQIKTDESRSGAGEQSAVQHAQGIASAMRARNFDLARERLNDFGAFVDHMGRKVAALNEHFAAGDPNADGVPYMALMPDRTLRPAKQPMYVNLGKEKSIELAQQIGFETEALTEIFNGLAGAFDELGVAHKVPVSLAPELLAGTPRELQQSFVKSRATTAKKPAAAPVVDEAPVQKTEAPTTNDTVAAQPTSEEVKQDEEPQSAQTDRKVSAGDSSGTPRADRSEEAKPAETAPVEAAAEMEPVVAESDRPSGVAAAFPGLIKTGKSMRNFFEEAFKLPAEAKSRLVGEESPLIGVYDAFRTAGSLQQFTGKTLGRDFSGDLAKAYRTYVQDVGGALVQRIDDQLQTKLRSKDAKGISVADKVLGKVTDANRWIGGKQFNLLAQDENGLYYQTALAESAALAGAQWLLTADSMGAHVDASDVAAMTGLPQDMVEHLVDVLDEGMSLREAARSLGQKIADYWGVVPAGKDIAQGYTEGIPVSLALELLRAMEAEGLIEVKTTYINNQGQILPADTKPTDAYRTLTRYVPKGLEKDDVKREFAGAIDHAVLVEPEELFYIDTVPPVATSQLRNPAVKLTRDQVKALEHDQATNYFVDQDMVNVYRALGEEGVLDLFGFGNIDPETTNETHFQSQDGKNRSVVAGFQHMETLLAELDARRGDKAITEVPVRFAYNFTRVNRMQMLGKHNPQSNKLIREMLLPTFSTLDLTNPEQLQLFQLGLAQGLGIKVHNMSRAKMVESLNAMLEKLEPAREKIRDLLSGGRIEDGDTAMLRQAFKTADADLTNVGFHALVDYVRSEMADDKSAFRTGVYVEADGVTNGPINSMALLSSGIFTERWVQNMGKGGMFFGAEPKTMNEHRSRDDKVDMYEESTNELAKNLAALRAELAGAPEVAEQLTQLESLMELFLKDLTFKDGALQMKRGIAKNPLTITIYGSGSRGIAGKLVSQVLDEVYEKMSAILQAQKLNPDLPTAQAMFGDSADAQAKYDRFWAGMHALLTKKAVKSKKKGWLLIDSEADLPRTFDPKTFKLDGPSLAALTDNMHALFVGPMVAAINTTVGQGVMDSAAALRDATQAQSLILADAFQREVDERLKQAQQEPGWAEADFLSREQLQEALDAVLPLAPFVDLDGKQRYFIAGSQSAPVTNKHIAAALDGTMAIEATAQGPANSGVAGIPFMVIGSGDGMMMQDLSTMPGAPGDNLKIFDGVNFRLDQLMENSLKANQAVYASWQRNPLQAVADSFKVTMDKLDLEAMTDKGIEALADAVLDKNYMLDLKASKQRVPEAVLKAALEQKQALLEEAAFDAEARHRVLSSVAMSVDQMAAAGAPYQSQGKTVITGTNAEIAAQLNSLLQREKDSMRAMQRTPRTRPAKEAAPATSALAAIASAGRELKSGVRELSNTALSQIGKALEMTPEQAALYGEAMRGKHLAGWKVVFGTNAQLREYASAKGMEAAAASLEANDRGVTLPGEKVILLTNPSVETLVHEMVHAATYEKVLAVEMGMAEAGEVATAVARIKALREQMLNGDLGTAAAAVSPEALRSFMDAKNAVLGALRDRGMGKDMREAIATNEFMAWVLANPDLVKAAKNVQASPLVRLAKAAIAAIKSLVWGKAKAPAMPEGDVASNLLFNTMVVMRGQMDLVDATADTALSQTEDSLVRIGRGFAQALGRIEAIAPGAPNPKIANAIKVAADAGQMVAAQGFTMDAGQMQTFRNMVAAMASQAKLDSNSMAGADMLYQHVLKNLEPEHFMADENSTNPADYYHAKQKYDAVVGNTRAITDVLGRETLMPVFLALSVASPDMRAALAKLPVPKANKEAGASLDAMLRNAGEDAMWALGRYTSGLKGNTLSEMADSLALAAADATAERANMLEVTMAKTGQVIDTVNDKMVEGLQALSDAALAAGDKLAQGNIVEKTGASILRGVAALVSEKNGKAVAEGVMAMANASKLWQPAFDMLNDLSGRTSSNAAVYDLIKLVRSTVAQTRQQFREAVPSIIREKFSRELTAKEWADLHTGLGKTDIAALAQGMGLEEARRMIIDPKARMAAIQNLEKQVRQLDGANAMARLKKADQLAGYMMGEKAGARLLRNADAIWDLAGNPRTKGNADGIAAIDQLVSLYALEKIGTDSALSSLAQGETEGVDFAVSYLIGQRVEESRKAAAYPMAKYNALKGNLPAEQQQGVSLVVANDADFAGLAEQSYVRVADYAASGLERGTSRGYYFAPVGAKAAFAQGIMQNVRMTAGGADVTNGFSTGMTAGRITDAQRVKDLAKWLDRDTSGESLIPVYDQNGKVTALERSIDPAQLVRLNQEKNLANAIGQWRGRQVEEVQGTAFNEILVDRLYDMWEKDSANGKKGEYVNLAKGSSDPVVADAVALLNTAQVNLIESRFGEGEFWVRRDMLHDALGYRAASVGDAWTGNTRWSEKTQETVKNIAMAAFGNDAYRYLVNGEKLIKNLVADVKTIIVVKSMIVPWANMISNVYQLISRGVPLANIARSVPKKMAEVKAYTDGRAELIQLEADLLAARGNPSKELVLNNRIKAIRDGFTRLSIFPLVQAGEFAAISDASLGVEERMLSEGRLHSYMEALADRLPESIRTAGKYALITKDTALFQGLQRAVDYSDFLAKAIIFDDLTQRKKMSAEEALGRVTEEFVNYDRLPGRTRAYAESMGLLWFYNFKIRISKIALSTIRNNPLHALLAGLAPQPTDVGLPLEDNLFTSMVEGRLGNSIGPGMGFRAPTLNPALALMN